MSVQGQRARNHRQQVDVRGQVDEVDDRWTPPEYYDPLHAEHGFTLDVAASALNAKCARYFTREMDGLVQPWTGEVVWCNPPYSGLEAWTRKAFYEVANGCPKAVLLLPANRTEQPFWQELIEPVRDRVGTGVSTRFMRRRPRFGSAANPHYWSRTSAAFGVVAVVIEPATVTGGNADE